MSKYTIFGTGKIVEINKSHYKFKGGEGTIYIKGNVVYKICDKGKMIPEGKIQELSILDYPKIIKPEKILLDSKKKQVGYTMKLVPKAVTLAHILTKTYREREGVKPEQMAKLVLQGREGIQHIHDKNCLQVDGNELNYMVTDNYEDLYFIDVNSFQTPHYPATAIMPNIVDYHVNVDSNGYPIWTEMSDWYSFCIISFYMFAAIHPFKGRHPCIKTIGTAMRDCMKECKSVLDPETKFPEAAVYYPFENFVPGGKEGAYMQWYRSILIENNRSAPPLDFQAKLEFVMKIKEIAGSNKFDIVELFETASKIVGFYASAGKEVTVTKKDYIIGKGRTYALPAERIKVGFTPIMNKPIGAYLEDSNIRLFDLEDRVQIQFLDITDKIMAHDGRFYYQAGPYINEIEFFETGSRIMAMPSVVANVMPRATQIFQGVAIQEMFGAYHVSVFPGPQEHSQVRMKELEGLRILDAKYENRVLMVATIDGKTGENSRFVFRFDRNIRDYHVRKIENLPFADINFTVTDNGRAICITEEEIVEIFTSEKDDPRMAKIDDPAIVSDMRLSHSGSQVRFAKGNKLFSISVRK